VKNRPYNKQKPEVIRPILIHPESPEAKRYNAKFLRKALSTIVDEESALSMHHIAMNALREKLPWMRL
jgi:hypothetical protein